MSPTVSGVKLVFSLETSSMEPTLEVNLQDVREWIRRQQHLGHVLGDQVVVFKTRRKKFICPRVQFFFKETSRRKRHVYLCFLQVFSHCRQIYQRPINFVFAGVGFPAWTYQVYNCVPNIRLATGYGDRCVGMSSAPLGENVKRKEIKCLNTIRWTECYFSGIMPV